MDDYSKDVKIFKALCDEKRLAILNHLKSGEKCACVLIKYMNIGQSALSYHMKILCESGLVVSGKKENGHITVSVKVEVSMLPDVCWN